GPPEAARQGARLPERARASHSYGAPPEGRPGDARGSVEGVRHQPRARAPDRGARLREAAEVHPKRRPGAGPGALVRVGPSPLPPLEAGEEGARGAREGEGFQPPSPDPPLTRLLLRNRRPLPLRSAGEGKVAGEPRALACRLAPAQEAEGIGELVGQLAA